MMASDEPRPHELEPHELEPHDAGELAWMRGYVVWLWN